MYFSFLKSSDTEFLYLPSFACVCASKFIKEKGLVLQPKVLPTFIETVWAVVVKKIYLYSCLSKVVPNPVTLPAFESPLWTWATFNLGLTFDAVFCS
jgi:hypothetical protein